MTLFLLDTNVVSETFKPAPDAHLGAWLRGIAIERLFISSITKAELLFGLALMPDGTRKQSLAGVIESFLTRGIVNSVLGFDSDDAVAFARISAHRRAMGRPIQEMDAQIAAIALTRGLSVATRNVGDFDGCGVAIVNPWMAK